MGGVSLTNEWEWSVNGMNWVELVKHGDAMALQHDLSSCETNVSSSHSATNLMIVMRILAYDVMSVVFVGVMTCVS